MAAQFTHSSPAITANTTRTLLYGPVSAGTQAIVFAGVFSNIDEAQKVEHRITVETQSAGGVYTNRLNNVPILYGAASMCPKTVLLPGESLYVTADADGVVSCSVEVLLLT